MTDSMPDPSLSSISGFRRLIASRFISNISRQIRMLVIMWQVWELTHKPIMLGYVGLAEGIPFIIASLFSGQVVDRQEKKRLILSSLAASLLCSVGLALVSRAARPSLLAVYVLIGIAALFSSLEMPASSTYLQMIVPREIFSRAAAWNLTSYVSATILGPILSGFLIARYGAAPVYALSAVGLAAAFTIAAPLRPLPPPPVDKEVSTMAGVKDGLRFVYSNRIIFASMALDSVAVLFGEVVFILPVFADLLRAGPVGLGFLRAAPAVGSCLVSLVETWRPVIRIRWDWLVRAVFVFGVCLIIFGISRNFALSFLMLLIDGAADGASVIIRQSLYQAHTPDAYRGRVASVSGIFISTSNEIGGFESGLAAQLMGTVPSVVFGGIVTLLTVAFMRWKYPRLDQDPA
jgi:MFS family permease